MARASKKVGKGRLDKYYRLAKEQGYRARSAFKLIQLNKKFGILDSARCCIDLCAAPGGWLQVASKYMPVNSVIVGVDLVPIKPIPRVITLTADITTPRCRELIRAELKNWKADVVLHDGAPNVGTAWVQDAFCQSELVLMSLRLAAGFLIKGGTFVTKVFRSVDYNNLIWVFNQLFGNVYATKPPSSRNVSAEIFVVCRNFLSPEYIDPNFFDPKHVFQDLSASGPSGGPSSESKVFSQKRQRNRHGYDENDYTLFKKVSAEQFVNGADPLSCLASANKIAFESDEEKRWLTIDITTPDIQINCDDLKVLGKSDFKSLLKWRLALREQLGLDSKKESMEEMGETTEIKEDQDEDQQVSEELERLVAEAAARTKRERRRANEIKARTLQRMQLKMTAPSDIGLEQNDLSYDIGLEQNDLSYDIELDDAVDVRQEDDDSSEGESVDSQAGESTDSHDVLKSVQSPAATAASRSWFSQAIFSGIDEPESSSDSEHDDTSTVTQDEDVEMEDDAESVDDPDSSQTKPLALTTPEAVGIAQQLVNREKTKTQLINDGFSRYALNSKEGLPDWFLEDEQKHHIHTLPITKEAVDALRARQRALDARPIKKVVESKARKKLKASQRFEKAMKNSERVNASLDMSEREKAQQIEKLMRRGLSSAWKAKKKVQVVVAKGAHKRLKGRPRGVKGRYVMVDARMKKEARAKKRQAGAKKRKA